MKESRQKIILDTIAENDIETQNQLIDALQAAGVRTTQATISRDIKELRLIKELTPRGTYRYAVTPGEVINHSERLKKIFRECVTSIACAQNIVVLKTLPGLAPAACSAVDSMEVKNLIGSLAGDDTAFLAMIDSNAAAIFCRDLKTLL